MADGCHIEIIFRLYLNYLLSDYTVR